MFSDGLLYVWFGWAVCAVTFWKIAPKITQTEFDGRRLYRYVP